MCRSCRLSIEAIYRHNTSVLLLVYQLLEKRAGPLQAHKPSMNFNVLAKAPLKGGVQNYSGLVRCQVQYTRD
jgi:hypothetical protein